VSRNLKVDSVVELTIWDGNEFQTLTIRFVKLEAIQRWSAICRV